jgi:hypothetical protein
MMADRTRVIATTRRSLGAMLGATSANDFLRPANGSGQAVGDHASLRTDPDNGERVTGIYRTEGPLRTCARQPRIEHFRQTCDSTRQRTAGAGDGMRHQFRIPPGIEQWAARMTAPLNNAWRGRPGNEARRTLGKIGFWIAQPGLDAASQRQLVALQRSRRTVADVATSAKRLELQITELERQADKENGQGNATEKLAELRRQLADLQAKQAQATRLSQQLIAEINSFRAGKEATKSAYTAAEEIAKTVVPRQPKSTSTA